MEPVKDLSTLWFEGQKNITFHDPLAAVTIFDGKICKFMKGDVKVELKDEKKMGKTYFIENLLDGKNEIGENILSHNSSNIFQIIMFHYLIL